MVARALALPVVVLVLVSGCGGSSDEGGGGRDGAGASSGAGEKQSSKSGQARLRREQRRSAGGARGAGDAADAGGAPGQRSSGGDGGGGGEDAAGAARAEVAERGDEICTEAHTDLREVSDRMRALAEKAADEGMPARAYARRMAELTAQTAGAVRAALAKLAALPRPDTAREDLRRYVAMVGAQAILLRKQAEAIGNGRAVDELNRHRADVARTGRRFARRFGFEVCGGGI